MIFGFIMHEVHAYAVYPSVDDYAKSCLCAWPFLSHVLFFVLLSPRAPVSDPLKVYKTIS